MKDRFKFRVWKGLENRMVDNVTHLNPLLLDESLSEEAKYNVLMQCTGLKDKNGKLIYEGDIVFGSWKTKLIVIYDVFIVIYDVFSSRFMLKTIKGQASEIAYYTCFDTQGEDIYCKNLEILGNIYENPELLEVKNDKIKEIIRQETWEV